MPLTVPGGSIWTDSTVSINEAFSPLLGVDATFQNNLTAKLEYRTTRVLSLSMTSIQINEALSRDWVVGLGYKIQDFRIFGSGVSRQIKKAQTGKGKRQTSEVKETAAGTSSRKSGVNHDLNLRLDISFRNQASITRDIAEILPDAIIVVARAVGVFFLLISRNQ